MKSFRAPWGTALVAVSAITTVSCIAVATVPLFADMHGWGFLVAVLPLALVVGTLPFAIRGYAIGDGTLRIDRPGWSNTIPLDKLESAEAGAKSMKCSIRTCGNGGLFSFTGWYWCKEWGTYRAWVTHLDRIVVLRFTDRTIAVSPEYPQAFLETLVAETGIDTLPRSNSQGDVQ